MALGFLLNRIMDFSFENWKHFPDKALANMLGDIIYEYLRILNSILYFVCHRLVGRPGNYNYAAGHRVEEVYN